MFVTKKLPMAIAIAATAVLFGGKANAASITVDDASFYTLGSNYALGSVGTTGFSVTAAGNNGNPSITAIARTYETNNVEYAGSGFATLNYFYIVAGPANVYVPVTITGTLSASGSGDSTSQATLSYYNGGINTENYDPGEITVNGYVYPGPPPTNLPGNENVKETFDVLSNQQLEISLFVDVNAVTGGQNINSISTASVDPTLTIAQSYLNQGYSLVLSPNITSAVPEPSTWAMLLLGFAGVGIMAYRRKSKPTLMLHDPRSSGMN